MFCLSQQQMDCHRAIRLAVRSNNLDELRGNTDWWDNVWPAQWGKQMIYINVLGPRKCSWLESHGLFGGSSRCTWSISGFKKVEGAQLEKDSFRGKFSAAGKLFIEQNRWPWFTWWFNHLPGPSISPTRTPMPVASRGGSPGRIGKLPCKPSWTWRCRLGAERERVPRSLPTPGR